MTIQDFYDLKKLHNPSYKAGKANSIQQFYNDFIDDPSRKIDPKILVDWHKLLVDYYYNNDNPIFFIRKYEGTKENGKYNTRRGAVVRFNNNTEIVYSSNRLAHDIYLMALNGFVPTLADFKDMVENRKLRNTIGTSADRAVHLYPGNNKVLKCYLAHIVGVNSDPYKMNNGVVKKLTRAEAENLYPLGKISDWNNTSKIYRVPRALTEEEKDILKAHSMRLLDPMNYFLTPQSENIIKQGTPGFSKNIGEYAPLIAYVIDERRKLPEFDDFLNKARYCGSVAPQSSVIDLSYDRKYKKKGNTTSKPQKAPKSSIGQRSSVIISFDGLTKDEFEDRFIQQGHAILEVTYDNGQTVNKPWTCKNYKKGSNLLGNIRTKGWYKKEKDHIVEVKCKL